MKAIDQIAVVVMYIFVKVAKLTKMSAFSTFILFLMCYVGAIVAIVLASGPHWVLTFGGILIFHIMLAMM